MVNESLAALTDAPMAVVCIQAAFLCLFAGLWSLVSEINSPSMCRHLLLPMAMWAAVACMSALHEMLSHLMLYQSSLCERTILMNCCPVLSHLIEEASEPAGKGREKQLLQARVGFAALVLGAVIFSIQMPELTFEGVTWACIFAAEVVPFRLFERWMLVKWPSLPIGVLACYNAAFLLVSSAGVAASEHAHFWEAWPHWASHDSILCMITLSVLTFCVHQVCELSFLRESTATNSLVCSSLGSVVSVALVVVFFGEKTWSSPCAVVGVFISITGGLWYAADRIEQRRAEGGSRAQPAGHAVPPQDHLQSECQHRLQRED